LISANPCQGEEESTQLPYISTFSQLSTKIIVDMQRLIESLITVKLELDSAYDSLCIYLGSDIMETGKYPSVGSAIAQFGGMPDSHQSAGTMANLQSIIARFETLILKFDETYTLMNTTTSTIIDQYGGTIAYGLEYVISHAQKLSWAFLQRLFKTKGYELDRLRGLKTDLTDIGERVKRLEWMIVGAGKVVVEDVRSHIEECVGVLKAGDVNDLTFVKDKIKIAISKMEFMGQKESHESHDDL